MRPSKTAYYLNIAAEVAKRSTCIRRQYGAVLVKADRIRATGYNGSPCGSVNCCDSGICTREQNNVPHGERYELCEAVHAEMNAIIRASYEDTEGATLYLAGWENEQRIEAVPCLLCSKAIKQAGILTVIGRIP